MSRLVIILLIVFAVVFMWKLKTLTSGKALRRQSRPLMNDQVEALLGRLAAAAGIDRVDVRVLEQPMINGLATPTGEIYVTEGLLRQFQSGRIGPREFTSVIAHELGHLALGHARRRMIDISAAQAAQVVLGGIIARFVPYVGWIVARWLTSAFIATLSRKDEFEADAYATALMVKAGLGAEAQASMLEKLEHLAPPGQTQGTVSWLASHPPVAERARAIRANASRWEGAEG
ncbi:MAG TPA: M48 family metalloprotease [Thermohalobaculum sp.]|nr:M48 family metalloprotease [Thermohalobaculum sp.]